MPARRPVRLLPALLALGLLLARPGVAPVAAQAATPVATPAASPALPPDATVGGLGVGDWAARAWQWLLSFPAAVNPALDATGERCTYGQSGPVFFLLPSPAEFDRNAPGDVTRRCTVPLGVALFAPVLQDECSTVEPPPFFGGGEAALRACARAAIDRKPHQDLPKMAVTVDGRGVGDVTRYRAQTPLFAFLLPPGNLAGVAAAVAHSVSDGYQVLLAPLPAGDHLVTIATPFRLGVHTVTYRLTVAPPQVVAPPASPAA